MRRGHAHHAVLIFVLFASVPVMMWIFLSLKSSAQNPSVKGVSSKEGSTENAALVVNMTSKRGTWDLYEYFCTSIEDCTKAVDSGVRWETLSGGQTDSHEIMISEIPEWRSYKYIKIFAKPSWGAPYRKFDFYYSGGGDVSVHAFNNKSEEVDAVLVAVQDVKSSLVKEVSFSDDAF